jgi:hypothetical protein
MKPGMGTHQQAELVILVVVETIPVQPNASSFLMDGWTIKQQHAVRQRQRRPKPLLVSKTLGYRSKLCIQNLLNLQHNTSS